MINTLGITAIGHQGAGKTCFLYAMYAQMVFGRNGFTFMPDDFDVGLELEEGWRQIVEEGTWPKGTDILQDFLFECSYSFEPMFTFKWHDYRGGLLLARNEPGTNQTSERDELFNRLQKSSSILLFIDADMIKEMLNNNPAAFRKLRVINQIVREYRNHNPPLPIALTITKADKLLEEEMQMGIRVLKEQCLQALFREGGEWQIIITAVELGSDLSGKQGEPVNGTIAPKNIHIPVLFPIYITMNQLLGNAMESLRQLQSERKEASDVYYKEKEKSGWSKFWNGDHSADYKEEIERVEENITLQEDKLEKLRRDLENMEREFLEGCAIYFDGKKMRFKSTKEI